MKNSRRLTVPFHVLSCLVLLAFPGCRQGEAPPARSAASSDRPPLLSSFPGHDAKMRWDGAGNLHVIYVEDRPGGDAIVYRRLGPRAAGPFTVSPAGIATAIEPESPPTIDVLPNGDLVTAYAVQLPGKWKSDVRVQRSTDAGATWSEPVRIHPPQSVAHSLVSSAVTTSGTLAFVWLDSRDGHMGLRAASTRDGLTFSANQSLDTLTCECCGTELLAGRGGRLWAGYRDLEPDNLRDFRVLRSIADPPAYDGGVKLSADGWKINGCPETGMRLAQAPDGTLWAAWFTAGGQPGVYVTSSRDDGASFAPRTLLSEPGRLARHPEIALLPGGRIAVLYESIEADGTRALVARERNAQGLWEAPRRIGTQGDHLRFAAGGGQSAFAFTCRDEKGSRVVVAPGSMLDAPGAGLTCG
jgi:hypothetical protein